ncbi:cellulose biosynthesis protein BcsS [Amylibacter sp. SFDW26]|uniref:cellulose biosynthesis protein BcsS n=1 Tax=Amylibacter sp. SFDW26 TaxID=2652722 RepID=UPI001261C985|nr:cellulose biosynthesis protein BcsS [Amylibacter sp. SFDW26]KAB7613487.1 cellulose biosynthesis protein BcsS [Amylibacter sp. SFDW26]
MLTLNSITKVSATALLISTTSVLAEETNSSVLIFGSEVGSDSLTVYTGLIKAFNGDLNKSGYLGRGFIAYGDYNYETAAVAGGSVDIEAVSGDLMLGYQIVGNQAIISGFAGLDIQSNALTPNDPQNSTGGSAHGFKIQGEVRTTENAPAQASLIASYSGANETYYSRGRIGFNVGKFSVGPEASLLGNEEYDSQKYGAFISGLKVNSLDVSVNVGYANSSGNGSSDGAYAGFSLVRPF